MNCYRSRALECAIVDLSDEPEAAAIVGRAERQLRRVPSRHRLFVAGLYDYAEPWGALVRRAIDVIAQQTGYPHPVDHGCLWVLESWLEEQAREANNSSDDDRWRTLDAAYWAVREARKQRDDAPGTRAVALACAVDSETREQLAAWVAHAVALAR